MVLDLLVHEDNLLFNNVIIIAAMIFYAICALWRLAYYNIIEADKYFTGLPVPGSMMTVTMSVWCVHVLRFPMWISAVVFFLIGVAMISGIQLKKYGMWQKVMSVISVVFLVAVIFYK
jgi:phosphatidylserine synthase